VLNAQPSPYAQLSTEQLRALQARALAAAGNHLARGLVHFAELCMGRANEVAAVIAQREAA
jgi:hypothetical protein